MAPVPLRLRRSAPPGRGRRCSDSIRRSGPECPRLLRETIHRSSVRLFRCDKRLQAGGTRRRRHLSTAIDALAPTSTPSATTTAALATASKPHRIEPMKGFVLVDTPSIDLAGGSTSSRYTPGYSGTWTMLLLPASRSMVTRLGRHPSRTPRRHLGAPLDLRP
jgi:hypothetical protein